MPKMPPRLLFPVSGSGYGLTRIRSQRPDAQAVIIFTGGDVILVACVFASF